MTSPAPPPSDDAEVGEVMECGDMEVLGQMPYASNATLLVKLCHEGRETLAIYKPQRGESPLWDFPPGTLCRREYAAWVVDDALGWGLVPRTVLRDGPAGLGAVQLFVDEDESADLDDYLQENPDRLRALTAFDAVINNADRKGGHCLVDTDGRLWAIDHGVTFNAEHKLRTVLWVFAGEAIPRPILRDLERLSRRLGDPGDEVSRALRTLLDAAEMRALSVRVDRLIRTRVFPSPGPGRRQVPWPPW